MTETLDTEALDSDIFTTLDISHLELEDDTGLDNFQTEKQQRLLVEPLYSSWNEQPYIAAANVGIFSSIHQDAIVPDVFLSLGVEVPSDWSQKQNRSYLAWQFGKFPEVVIEIVSNRKGNELIANPDRLSKLDAYARMGIAYYAVFDPLRQIQEPEQMNGELLKVFMLTGRRYTELPNPAWVDDVGLGLRLWQGEFEGASGLWLRWYDRANRPIPTGKERANQERERANQEQQRANQEQERANQERERADRLATRLQELGIDTDEM